MSRIFERVKTFMELNLEMEELSERDVWGVALLIKQTKGNERSIDCPLVSSLGKEGILLYRKIFKNNNKSLLNKFFLDSLIRRLW